MSRVLLVSSNLSTDPYPVYPLGMAVVAGGLAARGHEVVQFDLLACGASDAAFLAKIREVAPEVLGISLRNLDSCDALAAMDYSIVVRKLVQLARTATSAPIILGGPAYSILPEELLAFTGADYGVAGEGDAVVAELVEALAAGREMPRIVRGARPLMGGELQSPRYDEDLVRFYAERSGLLNVQTKRGCPHRCVYCSYPSLEGRSYRARDPEAVVDDLASAKARFGVADFFICDGVFNDGDGLHMEVVEAILRRGLDIRWNCYMRPQAIRREDLLTMKRAGLRAVELGTDAACDVTLAALAKGFTFEDVLETNETFVACEIPCAHFVMFGGPGETEETVVQGLANIARLRFSAVFAFTGIRVFPGTPIHALAVREGAVRADDPLREPAYYFSPHIDPERMGALIAQAFKGQRTRFFPPERGRERMEVLQRMGFRGLAWDTLIRYPRPAAEVPSC